MSLAEVESIILTAQPGIKAKIYSDKTLNIEVVTTQANVEGMCQKNIVSQNKKTGKQRSVIIMPLSKTACGN